jgi:hypothetical protein
VDIVSHRQTLATAQKLTSEADSGPEFGILCLCCGSSADGRLAALLRNPTNWGVLLRLSTYHRVLPAVYEGLRNRPEVPASIQSALEARFAAHTLRVLRFSAELAAILRQFQKFEVQAVAHKGPALAQLLYGDPAMREFGDLDFLIRTADVPRACEALRVLGLQPRLQLSPRQEREYLRTGYEYVFGSAVEPNLIELQWQILPRFYSVPFQMAEMLRRSTTAQLETHGVRVLGREDLFLVLCVHAAKHGWAQLGMIRDIAALAALELDWDWIAAEARRLGIITIVGISLSLARNLAGSGLLPSQADLGLNGSRCTTLVEAVERRLRFGEELDTGSANYLQFMMRVRERWRDRARFAVQFAFTPSVGEWKSVDLPDAVFPLYRGVRILRLLKRGLRHAHLSNAIPHESPLPDAPSCVPSTARSARDN